MRASASTRDPVASDRDADDVQAGRARRRRASSSADGSSTASRRAAGAASTCEQQRDALGVAVADHDVSGRPRAADPVEVVGERRAQLGHAAAVEVAEALVRRLGEHPADRAQPGGPRELARRRRGRSRSRPPAGRAAGPAAARRGAAVADAVPRPGCSRRPAGQVALGDELLVGLDDDAAGDAQIGGEGAGRRQRRASRQRARTGSAPGSPPRSAGAAGRAVRSEVDQQVRTGTNWSSISAIAIGPYRGTDCCQLLAMTTPTAPHQRRSPFGFDGTCCSPATPATTRPARSGTRWSTGAPR